MESILEKTYPNVFHMTDLASSIENIAENEENTGNDLFPFPQNIFKFLSDEG